MLNGRRLLGERLLGPADLRPGDTVALNYDTHVRQIDAHRTLIAKGEARNIQLSMHTFDIAPDGGGKPTSFLVSGTCKTQLGGEDADWTLLRDGDRVEASYDEGGGKLPEVVQLSAQRPSDPTRWCW